MSASAVQPLLEAQNLERRFGAVQVLRGVSLVVAPGECHLVVGPNGAGKSTLLRLLAGLARPSAGSVLVDGALLTREPAARRRIGVLSHQSQLYDELSAIENLSFVARLYGLADAAGVARARLAELGLGERGEVPVGRLSRGMVQRVAIARALLHGPRVLLLDEPFSGLDAQASERLAAVLLAERSAGRGLVIASHDVHESWELATHTHIMIGGRWVESGPRGASLDGFLRRYREALHG